MAELTSETVHCLVVNDDELELIHNLLWSGPDSATDITPTWPRIYR